MERFTNDAASDLDGGIDDSQTSLDVVDASEFPTAGNFRVKIGDELLLVTAVTGETFTVERGIEGTAAATHASGAVTHVLTTASFLQAIKDRVGDYVPPDLTDFTWSNQGDAVATQVDEHIEIVAGYANGIDLRVLAIAAPSTPYVVTAAMSMFADGGDSAVDLRWGLVFKNGTKLSAIQLRDSGGPYLMCPQYYTDFNTRAGLFAADHQFRHPQVTWLRLADNGTTRSFHISPDNRNWFQVASEGHTSDFTPNEVGIFVDPNDAAGGPFFDPLLKVLSWAVE